MNPLTSHNIESELSYAYLHAVASSAGVGCAVSGRHEDNAGVDARLTGWGPFPADCYREEVDIKVQLKATVRSPAIVDGAWSSVQDDWVRHTDDALSLHRCAYWVSLRGAPSSTNDAGETVYLPRAQRFDRPGLVGLMERIARGDVPAYVGGRG